MKELNQVQLDMRAKLMTQALDDGLSLQQIGDIFHLSKPRVYQITNNFKASKKG